MNNVKRRLIWHGMFIFLLGLCTGLFEIQFTNMRMGLAAHLEGIMNGIFLISLGAIWQEVHLKPKLEITAICTTLYGTYANWAFTTLAAVFGTNSKTPIAAHGFQGLPWQENIISIGLTSVGLSIIIAVTLILWGLRGKASE